MSITSYQDLTLEQVLSRFTEGPDTGIFTDGSARPNPGPGGWGFVWVENGEIKDQEYGSEADTTNNRMELTAMIKALEAVDDKEITIHTDSELTKNILTQWAAGWEKRGWKRKTGPIQNLDLVQQAFQLYSAKPNVKIEWVRAHNEWLWNEYADSLASSWAREEL